MSADLVLWHCDEQHVALFDALKETMEQSLVIEHVVKADWCARSDNDHAAWQAQREIDDFIRDIEAPVMCTCSALGEAAEAAGALRVDKPGFQQASVVRSPVMLVSSNTSSAAARLALLQECLDAQGNASPVVPLVLEQFQPILASGDTSGFQAAVAAAVIEVFDAKSDIGCVLLGDIEMAPVQHLLQGMGPTVLSLPEAALRSHARMSLGEPITT